MTAYLCAVVRMRNAFAATEQHARIVQRRKTGNTSFWHMVTFATTESLKSCECTVQSFLVVFSLLLHLKSGPVPTIFSLDVKKQNLLLLRWTSPNGGQCGVDKHKNLTFYRVPEENM